MSDPSLNFVLPSLNIEVDSTVAAALDNYVKPNAAGSVNVYFDALASFLNSVFAYSTSEPTGIVTDISKLSYTVVPMGSDISCNGIFPLASTGIIKSISVDASFGSVYVPTGGTLQFAHGVLQYVYFTTLTGKLDPTATVKYPLYPNPLSTGIAPNEPSTGVYNAQTYYDSLDLNTDISVAKKLLDYTDKYIWDNLPLINGATETGNEVTVNPSLEIMRMINTYAQSRIAKLVSATAITLPVHAGYVNPCLPDSLFPSLMRAGDTISFVVKVNQKSSQLYSPLALATPGDPVTWDAGEQIVPARQYNFVIRLQ